MRKYLWLLLLIFVAGSVVAEALPVPPPKWTPGDTRDTMDLTGTADVILRVTRDATNDTTKISVPSGTLVIGDEGLTIIDSATIAGQTINNDSSLVSEGELEDSLDNYSPTSVISSTYEVQLDNEAGLYAVLSDVVNFLQLSDTAATVADASAAIVTGNGIYDWVIGLGYLDAETDPVWVSDSADYAMKTWVRTEVEDSLNEYSLTTAIKALIADSLDEYSLTTAIRALIGDSLIRMDTSLAGHPIDTITANLSDGDVLQWVDATSEWQPVAQSAGGSTAYDDIGDPDGDGSVAMGAHTGTYTSATDGWGGMIIENTTAELTAATTLLTLKYTDDGDADGKFLSVVDATNEEKFFISQHGYFGQGSASISEAELEILDDATVTTAELNLLDADSDPTLGDIADGTIAENLVNTAHPWAADEIVATVLHNDEIDASSELLDIMDDETGTGVLVFATSPTFTTGITVPDNSISAAELNEGDAFTWTSTHDFGGATSLEIPAVDNPTTDAEGEIAWDANNDAVEVYSGDLTESVLIPIYKQISIPLVLPDSIAAYVPNLVVFQVNSLVYPFGIVIDSVSIQLAADAAYSMVIEEWSSADPPVLQNIISTVTTGATDTYAAEAPDVDGTLDASDRIILNIPATDVPMVTVNIIFHVMDGN